MATNRKRGATSSYCLLETRIAQSQMRKALLKKRAKSSGDNPTSRELSERAQISSSPDLLPALEEGRRRDTVDEHVSHRLTQKQRSTGSKSSSVLGFQSACKLRILAARAS